MPAARALPRRRPRRRLLIAVVALLAADQLVQHVALRDGVLLRRRIAPYDPPLFSPDHFAFLDALRAAVAAGEDPATSSTFDAELGWIVTERGRHDPFDETGGRVGRRPITRARRAGVRRVVAVGCSFTFGEEVGPKQSWPAILESSRDDVEVCNLGVSAYGTDQALLRYRRDGRPLAADDVWLGFVPSTLPRLESMYRPAYGHWQVPCWFKPRFELAPDGGLRLVPNPGTSPARTLELLSDASAFSAAVGRSDRWVARMPAAYAPAGSRLAHHSGIGRILLTLLEVGGRPDPAARLLDAEDPAVALLRAIVTTMAGEVAADGARFRLVVLPGRDDLQAFDARGELPSDAPALRALRDAGVAVVDVSRALLDAGALDDDALWRPGGHYAPAANRVVAEALAADALR